MSECDSCIHDICQTLKSDQDKIDPLETSGLYRIEFNKNNKKWILLLKRKVKERIKDYKGDIHNGREEEAVVKTTLNDNMNINYNKAKKLANYNDRSYAYFPEALEIASSCKACYTIEHFSIDKE